MGVKVYILSITYINWWNKFRNRW